MRRQDLDLVSAKASASEVPLPSRDDSRFPEPSVHIRDKTRPLPWTEPHSRNFYLSGGPSVSAVLPNAFHPRRSVRIIAAIAPTILCISSSAPVLSSKHRSPALVKEKLLCEDTLTDPFWIWP
jgi:hypothetical protein